MRAAGERSRLSGTPGPSMGAIARRPSARAARVSARVRPSAVTALAPVTTGAFMPLPRPRDRSRGSEGDDRRVSAEREGVRERDVHADLARDVRDDVEVAFRVALAP